MTYLGKLAAVVALGVAAIATPAAAADLVTNGGFETNSLSGWTVTGSNMSVATNGFSGYAPHSGTYFAILGDVTGTGSLSQTLSTVAGQSYTLSYYLASQGDAQTAFSTLWNGQLLSGSALANPNSGHDYVLFSFLVTGTGSDVLRFNATDVPSYLALDDVSLTEAVSGAVPEPSTWAMMLLGFGAIGVAVRRSRRKAPLAQLA